MRNEDLAARYLRPDEHAPLFVITSHGQLLPCTEPVEVRYVCGACRRGRVKPLTGTRCSECGSVVVGFG